jgi:hypothetical protein
MYSAVEGVPLAAIAKRTVTGAPLVLTIDTLNTARLVPEPGTVYTDVRVAAVGADCPKIPDAMIFP